MTDWELIDAYRKGSAEAMGELVRRHIGMVHTAALREVRDAQLAEDVTQAVFLVLMRKAGTLSRGVLLGGWLFTTTRYAAADARKKQFRRKRHEQEAAAMKTDATAAVGESRVDGESSALLQEAIGALSATDRHLVILRYLQGEPTQAVAQAMGMAEATVRMKLARAVERLRKYFSGRNITLGAAGLVGLLEIRSGSAAWAGAQGQIESWIAGHAVPAAMVESLSQGAMNMHKHMQMRRIAVLSASVAAAGMFMFLLPTALARLNAPAGGPVRAEVQGALPRVAEPGVASLPNGRAVVPVALPAAVAEPAADADAVKIAAQAGSDFATELFQVLDEPSVDKNVFFSPYSISTILALTSGGAGGNTADQMHRVLHMTGSEKYHAGIGEISRQLADTQGGQRPYQLTVANALWEADVNPFKKDFQALAEKYYGTAGVFTMNFRDDPEGCREKINKWVEDKTNSKIKELLPPPPAQPRPITKMTGTVLTNAIYFKAQWQTRFLPPPANGRGVANYPRVFHVTATKDVEAPIMAHGSVTLPYYEDGDVQVVSMPYRAANIAGEAAERASMVLIVPRKVDGLADVERALTAGKLGGWLAGMENRPSIVYLPRFEITCGMNLTDQLKAMGMTDAFDVNAADFSGISTPPPGLKLFISAVYHKAWIKVDEEGTEAAAATAVIGGMGGGRPPANPAIIRADHPFIFLIRYEPTNSILFMGHVADPTAK